MAALYIKPCDMDDEQFKGYLQRKFSKFEEEAARASESSATSLTTGNDPNSDEYYFGYPKRGLALIFNIENFKDGDNRSGSGQDQLNLKLALEDLDFDVIVFHDLTAHQIRLTAIEASKLDGHQVADCFVCVLLSHGDEIRKSTDSCVVESVEHILLGFDNHFVCTKDIVACFDDTNCQGLKNKPRLFFVQACRGEKYDNGVGGNYIPFVAPAPNGATNVDGPLTYIVGTVRNSFSIIWKTIKNDEKNRDKVDKVQMRPVPLYKDCLIMYATPPGYYAHRIEDVGCPFIIELCKFLENEAVESVSFLQGLTTVSRGVSLQKFIVKKQEKEPKKEEPKMEEQKKEELEKEEPKMEEQKKEEPEKEEPKVQIPVLETMLTKDIIMKKKEANRF